MKKVLVIGDSILDKFVYGDVERMSPESPLAPVLDYSSETASLGGTLNVAVGISSLANENVKVYYFGFLSKFIIKMLDKHKISFFGKVLDEDFILTKTRFIYENQQIMRLDNKKKYDDIYVRSLISYFYEGLDFSDFDLIVVSDYLKGTVSEQIINKIRDLKVPMILDYKKFLGFGRYNTRQCVVKCNEKEYLNDLDFDFSLNLVTTLGKNGYRLNGEIFPAQRKESEIVDVTGAGDSFTAGMAVEYLNFGSFNLENMCEYGNIVASHAVKRFGTYVVKKEDLL